MLIFIVLLLIFLWFAGLIGHIAGDAIYLLLLLALVIFVYDLIVQDRR